MVADVLHLLLVLGLGVAQAALAAAEVGHDVPGLLAQRALHQQRRALEELLEVRVLHGPLALLGRQLLGQLLGGRGRGRGLLAVGLGLLPRAGAGPAVVLRRHGAAVPRALGHLHQHGRRGLLQLRARPLVALYLLRHQVGLHRALIDVGLLRLDGNRDDRKLLLEVQAAVWPAGALGSGARAGGQLPQGDLGGGGSFAGAGLARSCRRGLATQDLGHQAVDAPAQLGAAAALVRLAAALLLLHALGAAPLELLDLPPLLSDKLDLLLALPPQRLQLALHAAL
mmetsp:Transcript_61706/g.198836  ORF Transcript_61706/g.198836 Transcript_61706/m.198836 type:complete len:283 (+) Transcript_61706:1371-2219(+)